jgi:hypothetical protein
MKKKIAFIIILVLVIYALGRNPHQVLSYVFYFRHTPPIIWHTLQIDYQIGMHFVQDDELICFQYYGRDNQGICIKHLSWKNNSFDKITPGKWEEQSRIATAYKGLNAFEITKRSSESGEYCRIMYIPGIEFAIIYSGPENAYADYQDLIGKIKILSLY